jgi:tetratricopeptide (TPR) repeat protein
MSDIFISYAREDKEKAAEFARLFEQEHWAVWWDRDLIPGDKFEEVIGRELGEAKAVVVLWSETSVGSGWVKDEARKGAQGGALVPLLIDPVNIPLGFGEFHTPDFTEWDGSPTHAEAQSLLRRISGLLGRPVVTLRPSAWQRLTFFYRRHRLGVVAGVLLAFIALLGLFGSAVFTSDQLDAARLTAEGNKLAGESNYEGAILIYNEAVNTYDAYPDVYYYRGQSFINSGEEKEALADFEKALRLNVREPLRRKAIAYVERLKSPANPTPMPTTVSTNTNTSIANTNMSAGNINGRSPANATALAGGDDALQTQVNQMFSADKDVRIEATTRLVIERKKDPLVVGLAVAAAAAQTSNLSGVINTLVLLESVEPSLLKARQDEVTRLLELVEGNGPVTARHVGNVRRILNR